MISKHDTTFVFIPENKGIGDLKNKSFVELRELLDRQEHLLSNKTLISKLKDKGEKIRKIKNEIEHELECRNSNIKTKNKTVFKNSSAVEWRNSKETKDLETSEDSDTENETNALKILSENGQVPIQSSKSHISRLLEKEKDQNFTFKPFNPAVAEKIKKVIPNARTAASGSLVKTIHLNESLNLLTDQMSALKVLGHVSRRVEECIEDRLNEGDPDNEQDNDETDEQETKTGISVNILI